MLFPCLRERRKPQMNENQTTEKTLSVKEYISYGIGPVGKNLMYGLVYGEYLPNFFRTKLGISNGFIAVMFFLSKIWDGVNDLLMGAVIDRTNSRFGKFRPWIFWGAVTNAVVSVMMYYNPGLRGAWVYVYVTALYLLCDLTFTMIDVGYWAMIPAMTLNTKERERVSILPRVTGAVGGLFGAFTLNIVSALGKGDDSAGYLRFSIIAAAVYIATSLICAAGTKEHVTLKPEVQEPFSLKKSAKVLLSNKQALVVVVIMTLFNAASCVSSGTMFYYFTNVLLKENIYGIYTTVLGIVSAIGLFGVPLLSKKLPRNKVYLFSYLLPCVGYVMMIVSNIVAPHNFILFAIAGAIPSVSYGAMSMMQSVMLSDAVDYGEWETGERHEGIIFSMLTFLSKMANGISYLIRYSGFALVHFDQEVGVAADEKAIRMIKFMLFVVPMIFLIAAYFIHKTKFNLTPDKMEGIRAQIVENRNKRAKIETAAD